MPETPERPSRRAIEVGGLIAGLVLVCVTIVLVVALLRPRSDLPAPASRAAPSLDAGPGAAAEESPAWKPAKASLAKAADVAFAAGASLSTDGKSALLDTGDGVARPVEVPAAITRVFGAAGNLFAAGENEGAPFLILMAPGEDPLVVPLPCAIDRLAGEGSVIAGLCADGSGLALSADGGRTFRPVPLELPAPRDARDTEIEKSLEAVSVSPSGAVAVAASQRWQSDAPGGALAWTWGQVALRGPGPGKPFRLANVQALVRTVGVQALGGAIVVAGLEVALDASGAGEVRPRLFRGAEGEPPLAVGTPGPACGDSLSARSVDGVLLGSQVAVFRCKEGLASTVDGGATWRLERLGSVDLLRGGDMRLFARAGERAWERLFVNRSETGATAVRIGAATLPRRTDGGAEAGPITAAYGIREPEDAGTPDATP